jgi:type VI secretion system secreted protein Hcp
MSNNMFLKFTGGPVTIEGETLDSTHEKWVDIESFSWGAHHPATIAHGTGASSGASSASEFVFMKKVDSASHSLLQALVQAAHVSTVNLEVMKTSSGGTTYAWYKAELSPCMITSFQSGGSGDPYMESVTIAYGKAKFTYTPQDQAGEPLPEKEVEHDFQTSK